MPHEASAADVALRLAADGHNLVLAARRKEPLEEVARLAESRGAARTLVVVADVSRRDDVERLSTEAIATFGGYDVWEKLVREKPTREYESSGWNPRGPRPR